MVLKKHKSVKTKMSTNEATELKKRCELIRAKRQAESSRGRYDVEQFRTQPSVKFKTTLGGINERADKTTDKRQVTRTGPIVWRKGDEPNE